MALPDSGEISLSEIATQYGGSAPHSLKDYYRGGTEGVPDTASTQSIPESGEIGLKDFYGSSETNNRDIRVWMSYLFSPIDNYGFGLTTQSSTDAPGILSNGPNAVAWQPVFRAGQGYITTADFTVSQNENVTAYNNNVVLYGGTSSSSVTNVVAAWNAGYNGSTGGARGYRISWNNDGTISSITQISTTYNYGIITWAVNNVSAANSGGYTWFGFYAKNPPSYGKGARVLGGTFYNASSVPQPS